MYWNEKIECMEREDIRAMQQERLRDMVNRVYHQVPHYKKKFIEMGITPADIQTLEDIKKLPFTTKQDLRDNYPFGMFAVPQEEIVRLHASSGTTGKPTVVGYTEKDIENWSELVARSLTLAGATRHSVIQVAYGYGLFTGGLGIHYGAERVKASVVPISGGNTKRQLQLMQDFESEILTCTPSYALYIAEVMNKMGIDTKGLKLRAGIFGAEPWSEQMRKEIENKLNIDAYDIYGLSEIMGPGVAMECSAKTGLHIWEDHFIAEIICPDTGEVLPYGEKGELVLTTITKEGIPVIRYRTRDITTLNPVKCTCGRTHVRMDKVAGRSDDMLIIRGVNVFPSQVESVLLENGKVAPFYQLVIDRKGTLDTFEVWVEATESVIALGDIRHLQQLERELQREMESLLGISVKVKLVEPNTIPRTEGKAKRVIDKRNI